MIADREFEAFCDRKRAAADAAALAPLRTIIDRASRFDLLPAGNPWSSRHFDGPFWTSRAKRDLPATSVVFVQSRDGNTATDDPESLGAGATDTHLIYEGLSRVAVDGVLVGAATLHRDAFFSVWRRELVELRLALGLSRHPAQIVLTRTGRLDLDGTRLFNVPDVPVFVLTSPGGLTRLAPGLDARPWVRAIDAEGSGAIALQMRELLSRGQQRISCVGGRHAATALVDAGVVQEVYLTTAPRDGGVPRTPWYVGDGDVRLERVLAKTWEESGCVVRFEHFRCGGSSD